MDIEEAKKARERELAGQSGEGPREPQGRRPQQGSGPSQSGYVAALRFLGGFQVLGGAIVAAVLNKAGVVERQSTERVGLSVETTTETVVSWAHMSAAGGVALASVAGAVVMFAVADLLRRAELIDRKLDKVRAEAPEGSHVEG